MAQQVVIVQAPLGEFGLANRFPVGEALDAPIAVFFKELALPSEFRVSSSQEVVCISGVRQDVAEAGNARHERVHALANAVNAFQP
ncbi:unannotated protein [freshwater metagenome]|uniref:Unannotated protein n=1 Tax=freshwater metagenome TaxID=449393 RepID=A0A6J6KJ56_9ZZZZ